MDPDQMASSGANESGSIVFSKQDISGFSVKRGVKPFCRLKLNNLQTHRSLGICTLFFNSCPLVT